MDMEVMGMIVNAFYQDNVVKFRLIDVEGFVRRCKKMGRNPNDITVYLSRHGDGCPTPIASMELHDGHTPAFKSEKEKSSRASYVSRVKNDVEMAVLTLTATPPHLTPPPLPKDLEDKLECEDCGGEHYLTDCNNCNHCGGGHQTEDCETFCWICDSYGHEYQDCEAYWCDDCESNEHDTEYCESGNDDEEELNLDEAEADAADNEFMESVSDIRP
jgi:hypothetical protein